MTTEELIKVQGETLRDLDEMCNDIAIQAMANNKREPVYVVASEMMVSIAYGGFAHTVYEAKERRDEIIDVCDAWLESKVLADVPKKKKRKKAANDEEQTK